MMMTSISRLTLRAWCAAAILASALVACANSASAAGLTFNTTIGPGLSALAGTNPALAANVQAGFAQAQAIWSSQFNDPIQVNLMLDWQELDLGTLASASSVDTFVDYTDVRSALAADRTSNDDFTAVANLPAGAHLSGLTNNRDGSEYFTDAPSVAASLLYFNRANAKALGLLAADSPQLDATVRFNTRYANSWDFNHTPTAGKNDFIGVAIHEIGHALGFTSGVSGVDQITGNGPYADVDLNDDEPGIGDGSNIPAFKVLDLFRHSDESNAIGSTVLDLSTGGSPYLQIDGSTPLSLFSTGEYNGDGRQPSHWKSGTLAVMKPSHSAGTTQDLTALDLVAFDVIGYDLVAVPEPSSLMLASLAGLGMLFAARRRRHGARPL